MPAVVKTLLEPICERSVQENLRRLSRFVYLAFFNRFCFKAVLIVEYI